MLTRHGRDAALVVLALEVGDGCPGRLRTRLVPDDTAESLVGFVQEAVEVGSTVITDGWTSYLALPEAGFVDERVIEGRGEGFANSVPHLDHAIGNLKAWLAGTHKGVSRHHLAVYLDEFVFRHNLAAAFQTLLGLGATRDATTYDTITGAKDVPSVSYAPSRKQAGTRKRRRKFVPAAPTPTAENP